MITTQTLNPKVDAYLAKVQPFARPIMEHLRELVHQACPEIEETIKWSRPFFEYRGVILCNMSAFKEHCSFGFWGEEIAAVLREAKVLAGDGMGSFGRMASLKDLPSDKRISVRFARPRPSWTMAKYESDCCQTQSGEAAKGLRRTAIGLHGGLGEK